METSSITEIKKLKDIIYKCLEDYITYVKSNSSSIDANVPQYGSEQEYSINNLIAEMKNILRDVSYLVKSHNVFIKISTYTERNNIKNQLSNLNSHINNKLHQSIALTIDALKAIIRNFNLQMNKDYFFDYISEIDNLRNNAMLLDEEITNTKNKLVESTELLAQIYEIKTTIKMKLEEINVNKNDLLTKISDFTDKYKDFEELADKAAKNENNIVTSLKKVKENESIINEFVNQIEDREKQLMEQIIKTQNYETVLANYSKRQQEIEQEAEILIDNARQALHYSNATSLSAAFSDQHKTADSTFSKIAWLVGSGVFILLAMSLGIWIIVGWGIDPNIKNPIMSIVGRLSLVPFALLAAIFCANQYVKQKILIEDYAYKTVLAKSLVAFSEELRVKEPEKYAEYLSTVLKEIHQDPLRKRDKIKDEVALKDTSGLVEKILEGVKGLILNKY